MSSIAVIGTRSPDILQQRIAGSVSNSLSLLGWRVKTGAADGIDTVAMKFTCKGKLDVYLPWEGYNRHVIPEHANRVVFNPAIHQSWAKSVREHHHAANRLSSGAFKLHARNYGIITDGQAVDVVLALPRTDGEGGTAQGIRIARSLGIPVWEIRTGHADLVDPEVTVAEILAYLKEKEAETS